MTFAPGQFQTVDSIEPVIAPSLAPSLAESREVEPSMADDLVPGSIEMPTLRSNTLADPIPESQSDICGPQPSGGPHDQDQPAQSILGARPPTVSIAENHPSCSHHPPFHSRILQPISSSQISVLLPSMHSHHCRQEEEDEAKVEGGQMAVRPRAHVVPSRLAVYDIGDAIQCTLDIHPQPSSSLCT